jgi:biopolymer transport protein ExbD
MAKAKVARKSTAIDMTPMVDLAFLLITFFMLTIKFTPPEAVEVAVPSSIATTPVDAVNVLNISISKDGRVFMGLSQQPDRVATLARVASKFKLEFTPKEIEEFKLLGEFGVPASQLKQFLNADPEIRKQINAKSSIPIDSTDNQLETWMLQARLNNPELRITIKADKETPYPVIRKVVNTLKKQKANRFNLITSQEADPRLQ